MLLMGWYFIMDLLRKAVTIGIFTPSSSATVTAKLRFDQAKSFLENKGFTIVEGMLTAQKDGYRSGTPKDSAEELNQFIKDPTVKMIMSTIAATTSKSI